MQRFAAFRIHQSICGKGSLELSEFWPFEESEGEIKVDRRAKLVWGENELEAKIELNNFLKTHGLGKLIDQSNG